MRVLSIPFFVKFDLPVPCALEASIIFSVTKTSVEVRRRQNLHCRGSNDTTMTDCFREAYIKCRYFTHTHTHTHTRARARAYWSTRIKKKKKKREAGGRLPEFWREGGRERKRSHGLSDERDGGPADNSNRVAWDCTT